MRAFAAVDLGATSGRVVIGRVQAEHPGVAQSDMLTLELVNRFDNGPVEMADGLHWNFDALYENIVDGLAEAVRREPAIESIGIDSWAVDYGLLRDGVLIAPPFHYRDERCERGVTEVHDLVSFPQLYARNGLQFLPFNTLYQLRVDDRAHEADMALLVPDLVAYLLTGNAVAERTNASTTGLVQVGSTQWDTELAAQLGINAGLFPPLVEPGTVIGAVQGAALERIGKPLPVVAVGSHDTASAVVGTPLSTPDAAYISCGTWGLVGSEIIDPVLTDRAREENFTHEIGVDGRIRFLHNVTGLWLLSETIREWERHDGTPIDLGALLAEASEVSETVATFDANDPALSAPGDMPARITALLEAHGHAAPTSRAAFARAIIESIAMAFAEALAAVGELTGRPVDVVHLVGGGSLNTVLCQATADRSGLPVLAGPVEATAWGNVLVQARAAGMFGKGATLEQMRALIAHSHEPRTYTPRH